ncbi:hypothetical protein [Streptomyces sp. WMMB 322]|nr:hypothetical protein [Streptomyces sp. WMMB 322]SCK30844.1 hypothetical protein H180DRAFT_02421 [Streptomyces sp. WMMB 322]
MNDEPQPAERPENEDPPRQEELGTGIREANRQGRAGPCGPAVDRAR